MKYKFVVKLTGISLIFFIILIFLALLFEVYVRLEGKHPVSGIEYDDQLIWRLHHDHEYTGKYNDNDYLLKFNKHGFRGKDFTKNKEAANRIIVIGDSYTAGLDFPDSMIFTSLLEKRLNSKQANQYEVINISVPAWATDQHYIFLKNNILRCKPDHIIMMVAPNDIREAWAKKLVEIQDGSLKISSPAIPLKTKAGWWLTNKSAFYQYLQNKVLHTNYGSYFTIFKYHPVNFGKRDSENWDLPLFLKEPFNEVKQAKLLFSALLDSIYKETAQNDITFSVSVIPTKMEFDETLKDSIYEKGIISKEIKKITTEKEIPFLDLYSAFKKTDNPLDHFISHEYHFNPKGHKLTATELYHFIKKNN